MRFTIAALFAAAAVVMATEDCGCEPTTSKWAPKPTPTPSWTTSVKSTPKPTAAPSCAYTCTTVGLVNVLDCTSLLNGNTVSLNLGDVVSSLGGKKVSGDYCCKTTGLINVLDCVSLLDGNTISITL